jgi:CRP-like cAMP-binding protein
VTVSLQALRAHPFFRGIDDVHLETLAALAAEGTFSEGAYLLRRGDAAGSLYLVLEGVVSLEVEPSGRRRVHLDKVEGGGIVGFAWLVPPFRWSVDARAVRPVRAIVIDGDHLRGAMHADPALGFRVAMRVIAHMHQRLERDRRQQAGLEARLGVRHLAWCGRGVCWSSPAPAVALLHVAVRIALPSVDLLVRGPPRQVFDLVPPA